MCDNLDELRHIEGFPVGEDVIVLWQSIKDASRQEANRIQLQHEIGSSARKAKMAINERPALGGPDDAGR